MSKKARGGQIANGNMRATRSNTGFAIDDYGNAQTSRSNNSRFDVDGGARNVRLTRSNKKVYENDDYDNVQPSRTNINRHDDSNQTDNLSNALQTFKEQMNDQRKQMKQLTDSYEFMSDAFDRFQEEITRLSGDSKHMKKQIERLQRNERDLVKRIQYLESTTAKAKQTDNGNHMIVTNVPKIDSAIDLKDFVVQIGRQVQMQVNKDDIIEVFQNENKKYNSHPIILKMKTSDLKTKCMQFRREKNTINIKAIIPNAPETQTKVNFHHLIEKEFSDLLKKAKDIGRNKNYKYIWFKDSTVFARKEDNSTIIKIRDDKDLDKIV